MMKGFMSVLLVLVAVSSAGGKPDKPIHQQKIPQQKIPQHKIPQKKMPQTLSRGWGDELTWCQTYEEALYRAHTNNKPLMVIFHLEECPHSQALKNTFANSKKVQKMADEDFMILNLVFETTDNHLYPDGQYVPRILFVDPAYTVRADIIGKYANRMYTYEPDDIDILYENMQKAKRLLKTEL